MRIVVLDGYTLNPGDLSWDELGKLGDLTVYDRTPDELIVPRSAGAEILLTNKTPVSDQTIDQLPDLRYIGVLATGYDVVDVAAAGKRGIVVTNVPAYGTPSVAEMVFALLFELVRHVQLHSDVVRDGEWRRSPDFSFWKTPQIELSGKTMGIICLGRIGRHVARIADAFGMRVLASDLHRDNPPALEYFEWAETPDLLARSDVVSLHCALTCDTQGLINRENLARMKPGAFVINTARGKLVNDADLAEALNSGRLAGAGLDVLSTEPPSPENPLLTARNCVITPHIAWATREARERLMKIAVENVKAFLGGKAVNVVA